MISTRSGLQRNRIRSEWTTQFHLVNLDDSGVVRFSCEFSNPLASQRTMIDLGLSSFIAFAALIRARLPAMEDRGIVKIYHQCGEENDLGEYSIAVVRPCIICSWSFLTSVLISYFSRHTSTIC
jgi:hypothetical protein